MIETWLCIGGPLAGKRKSFKGRELVAPILEEIPREINPNPPDQVEIKRVIYQRMIWNVGDESIVLLVPSDQSPKETLLLLLEAYERSPL